MLRFRAMHAAQMLALTALGAALALSPPSADSQAVKVVATLPVLKEFAEQVGQEHVQVATLISGLESEHTYSPKPSDLRAIEQARLLLKIGLGLEVWVSGLIKNAGNTELRVITTSENVPLITDEGAGAHGPGNPHIWLDPENAKIMSRNIAEGLIAVDSAHKGVYLRNLESYVERIERSEKELHARVTSLRDRRIITHHPAWPYFARRFGFHIEGEIVRQVGAEATAAHLARLAHRIKTEKIKVIVSEPQLNQKITQALARETGARVVLLSPLPGAIPGTATYLAMLEYDIAQLVAALQS